MAQRPIPLLIQADKRVSQVSQTSEYSVNSNSSDPRRHKQYIGPWQLGRTLGRGSSGRVRLAKHSKNGKLAAIKIVPKITAANVKTDKKGRPQERIGGLPYGLEREIVIMKLIEHPNILQLQDVWENNNELYLVLEYVEGGELFDYLIRRKRLPEYEAVDYIQQVLSAVDYCHRFNICHRDLKPENLLLDRNKQIKVADFGMAALEPSGQLLQTSCGSPHYASPEIISGQNYHGGPSDIWSCGIILFALLTGHHPFDDADIRTLLQKVKTGYFAMPTDLGMEAKDLLWRMLEVDPLKRIKMEQIMAHPLILRYKRAKDPRLPRAPTYQELGRPVNSASDIDHEILKNLQTLWRGAPKDLIIRKLLEAEQNAEKTFYLLLLKYRHDRLENYDDGEEDAMPRMLKSASKRSLKSIHSKKSSSSRKGHHKSGSKASKISATSSHRRGVSFSSNKKRQKTSPPPPVQAPSDVVKPTTEREVVNYALPRRESPSKRFLSAGPADRVYVDESTRKMSAEFSQFLDMAFNTATSPTSVLEDPESYQARALPRVLPDIPLDRPSSVEPFASSKIEVKQRAHRSAEVAPPLPRIFEEDRDKYADADAAQEKRLAAVAAQENRRSPERPKVIKGYSYPSRPRVALGELAPNALMQAPITNSSTAAAVAAMRGVRKTTDQEQRRIASLENHEAPAVQVKGRRFFSDPTHDHPKESAVTQEQTTKKSWFGRKFSILRAERRAPTAPVQSVGVFDTVSQQSPPGHPRTQTSTLAARRAAPAPPRIALGHGDSQAQQPSPPFPHPSNFSTSPLPVKQSFFARILGVKPASRSLYTTHNPTSLQRVVVKDLRHWESNGLGIKILEDNTRTRVVRGRVTNRNALALRAVRFRIEFRDHENGSQAIFYMEKGANSSFVRVVEEIERNLSVRDVLLDIRAPSRLSAYAV